MSATTPGTQARKQIVAANITSDLDILIALWEQRTPPFDRDVVLSSEVVHCMHKNWRFKPSAIRVGKLLTGPQFKGKAIQFRVGERVYRGIVLWNQNRWVKAYGREILDHIQGNGVDVTDPLLA
jgi:hypothetical protein